LEGHYGKISAKRKQTVQSLHNRLRTEYDSAYGRNQDVGR
jgi:hypothetical protein